MRCDLEDAGDEELEDRLVEAATIAKRPLNLDELARVTRKSGVAGQNFNESILSGILSQNDFNAIRRS